MACDAAMAPIVTGEVNPAALEDLIRLCVQLDKLRYPGPGGRDADPGSDAGGPGGDPTPAAVAASTPAATLASPAATPVATSAPVPVARARPLRTRRGRGRRWSRR